MQSGALDGDVIPLLPRLPRSPRPGGYAMATGGGDAGEREAVGTIRVPGVGIKRRVICQGLGNDYTMAAPSPLLHHDACPRLRMDPVGPFIRWYRRPHTVVNVSMRPLLFIVLVHIKKVNTIQ